MKKLTLLSLLVLSLQSCQLFYPLMGMRAPKELSDKQIEKYAAKVGITDRNLYKISDRSFYAKTITADSIYFKKDFYQPLQIIYFNEADSAQFHLINCNVGGFPLLEWNRYGSFDTYPPKMKDFYKVDSVLYKPTVLNLIKPVNQTSIDQKDFEGPLIMVLYSRIVHKNVKHLIPFIEAYKLKFTEAKVVYVNTDNFYNDDE